MRDWYNARRGAMTYRPHGHADDEGGSSFVLAVPPAATAQDECAPVLAQILAELEAKDPTLRARIDACQRRIREKWSAA